MTTTTATDPQAVPFQVRASLLDRGRTMDLLARSDTMYAHIKVYAEGGENALHTHTREDHLFVVLAGEATFRLGRDEALKVVGKNEGVLLPAGSYYWFQSSGQENLVMLRVGAKTPGPQSDDDDRMGVNGAPLPADSAANKKIPPVVRPGAFFG